MKITIECNSLEEMQTFAANVARIRDVAILHGARVDELIGEVEDTLADEAEQARASKPVVTTKDLKDPAQMELVLEGEHPAQTKAAEPDVYATATAEDLEKAKRSTAAKKAAATRKKNDEARKAKANGKAKKVDVVTPGDEPLPGSPEARKAERKARETLSPEQRESIDNPPTYAEVKAAVDTAVNKFDKYDDVLALLTNYEVKSAKELDKVQWRMFMNDVVALHG